MTPSLSTLILLAVLGVLVAIPPAFGASLLTDTELDTFGSGGESLASQAEDSAMDPLSDQTLAYITAKGVHGFIWPFQYAPLRHPGPKRITWSSPGDVQIDLGPAQQWRRTTPPPSPGGAGSANASPLFR